MPKILIVDDHQIVRELLAEELIDEGYRVVSTGDAESVIGRLRSSRPDLVLIDVYLDGADRWDVIPHIKSQNPRLPVIIFTAYDRFVDDPRLSMADGYAIKSVCLDELKQKIADVLRQKPAPQGKAEAKSQFARFSHGFG